MGDLKISWAHSSVGVEKWSCVDLHQSLGSGCFFLFLLLPLNLDFGGWLPPLKRTYDRQEITVLFLHISFTFCGFFLRALGVGDNLVVTPSSGVTRHSC